MESGSFQTLQPVSFKLASQKRPRRSGQIKSCPKGRVAVLTSASCDISGEDELKAPLVVKKQLFTQEYLHKTISGDFS